MFKAYILPPFKLKTWTVKESLEHASHLESKSNAMEKIRAWSDPLRSSCINVPSSQLKTRMMVPLKRFIHCNYRVELTFSEAVANLLPQKSISIHSI